MKRFTALYVYPTKGRWHCFRFIVRDTKQDVTDIELSTMFDVECYAKRHGLRIVCVDGNKGETNLT